MADAPAILTFTFADAGAIPNNPALPALVYKHAGDVAGARDPEALARWFEET